MSQADELLDSLEETTPSLLLADSETEPHIVISDDRIISVPKQLQRIAVQYDHNVETVTFDCPRYWDGLDMSQLSIYINYRRKDRVVGCYKATDITIDDVDTSIMHFNWTIYRHVTEVIGPIVFLVCITKTDDNGNEENHWHSELNTEMYISEGLETGEIVLESYPNIILQLEEDVQAVKDSLLAARDSGEFDGATFTPSVDTDGNLSWTNDKGRENPATVNIKGYSPRILVRDIDGGHELIITDLVESKTVQVMDGVDASGSAAQALMDAKSYTDEKVADSQKLDLPISASSTDGVEYTATVPGITALTAGQSFIMVPERQSTDMSCTLNVNNLGAKRIIIRGTGHTNTTAVPFATNWLAAATPVRVTYNGARWVADVVAPDDRVSYGTRDLTAGTSTLATGHLYFVYE